MWTNAFCVCLCNFTFDSSISNKGKNYFTIEDMCSMWRLLVALSICLFESKICVVELSTMQHVYYSETNRNQAHFLFTAF